MANIGPRNQGKKQRKKKWGPTVRKPSAKQEAAHDAQVFALLAEAFVHQNIGAREEKRLKQWKKTKLATYAFDFGNDHFSIQLNLSAKNTPLYQISANPNTHKILLARRSLNGLKNKKTVSGDQFLATIAQGSLPVLVCAEFEHHGTQFVQAVRVALQSADVEISQARGFGLRLHR